MIANDRLAADAVQFGPWNPGIQSPLPERLRHLSTAFRSENGFTSATKARELRDFTGLDYCDLAAFRPERLALHELLVRVTADVSVPDGPRVEDLGINFRHIVRTLLTRCLEPRMRELVSIYESARRDIARIIDTELTVLRSGVEPSRNLSPTRARRGLLGILSRASNRAKTTAPRTDTEYDIVAACEHKASVSVDPLHRAAYGALTKVIGALYMRHGHIIGGHDVVASLASDIACNDFASDAIGHTIGPWITATAAAEGYRLLPRQDRPVVMNTKGASASGKSTIRPLQRRLADDIGVSWSEFALISPDIWRKQLLDYGSLGAEHKYAGPLTGDELRVIDSKLDRYMARKAERDEMTHLLIDRFRFDSFAPDSHEAGSNLLTRFGQIVYLFFMITPPESLVERAWKRGLELGRYKAVDDTLAHAVEAYSGMPELFFTWVQRAEKLVRFEFLDNTVKLGERPRTVAFGSNDALYVLDVKCMLDVDRYRRIDVNAKSPGMLYPQPQMLAPEHNATFLRQCVTRFASTCFANQADGRIYLQLERGTPVGCDRELLRLALRNADARAGLLAVVPQNLLDAIPAFDRSRRLQEIDESARLHTLGEWDERS